MKSKAQYLIQVHSVLIIISLSTCKDPNTIPDNLICFEEEPCIVENACKTILAPRSAFAGKTFDINGETYTVVCNLLIREKIDNGEDLSKLITTLVTDMSGLFEDKSEFNADISTWDVSNVTNMASMFRGASSFNQDISCWDVNNVADMTGMFEGAAAFNQDISKWNVEKVTACGDFARDADAWAMPMPNFINCKQ